MLSTLTVSDVLTQALREIRVIRATQTLAADQLADGITYLNQMMADWEQDGIELGWYPVTQGSDTLRIEAKNEIGVMFNLAILLAGQYGAPLQPTTTAKANRTFRRLERSTIELVEVDLSDLPRGRRERYNIRTDEG